MNKIAIILVNPQMGENIGATARAMKNFGLKDLRIVSPRDGWPNPKAQTMSVGALDLVDSAKIFDRLPEAIADLEYIYAATAAPRAINKNYVLSKDLSADLPTKASVGVMFGRENCGLNNEEISYANKILTIDTDLNFTSLNIAHSVAIICYELFRNKEQNRSDLSNFQELAEVAKLDYFYNYMFSELEQSKFFRVLEKKDLMMQRIRNIYARIDRLSNSELQILHGIVAALANKTRKTSIDENKNEPF